MIKTMLILLGVITTMYLGYLAYRFVNLDSALATKIAKGGIILDVRTVKEYNTGHIKGSINISMGTIRDRYIELDPEKTYITTCSHGLRSVKVQKILKELGFKHVYNGGAWVDLEKIVNQQDNSK
ncbi:rhodanese-like domain-containing protein [Pedobacter psychroterrae]|uniref:Rhodanese-like domain-containing protein n=1 Tax=Pedobacter psychroterrae TaxID=2530453 RepID=A0A4V2MLS3_9SPHI|nr:rhodanese-like domain-containing protein [Pedobacter psychroterrae]TCD03197.1 rhodanese-like domain-containing protein [Pedobacter psychroterrae]